MGSELRWEVEPMLSLAEELLLLALEDTKGTVAGPAQVAIKYGLAAAGMIDLVMMGRLAIGEDKKVSVVDASTTGDDILDEMVAEIARARKPKKVGDWVSGFGNGKVKKLDERLESRLVDGGILRREEGRTLGLFPWRHYPTLDGSPEARARQRLEDVLLGGSEPDERTAVLVSLTSSCKLLHVLFPKEHHKRVDARAKQIAANEIAGQSVSRAVAEAAAAATAAAMVAISAASVSSSSS